MIILIFLILLNTSLQAMNVEQTLPKSSHELISDCAFIVSRLSQKRFEADVDNESKGLWSCEMKDNMQTRRAQICSIMHNAAYSAQSKNNDLYLQDNKDISRNHVGFVLYKHPYACAQDEQSLIAKYIAVIHYMQYDWHSSTKLERKTVLVPTTSAKRKPVILIKNRAFQGESALINYLLEQNNLKKYAHASSLFCSLNTQGETSLKCYDNKINLIVTQKRLKIIASFLGLVVKFNP